MKFGYKEIKEFAENHEDERVRIMYRRLCEARSKNAKWCEEVEKLKEENKQLRLGWCRESEKRMKEWYNEQIATPNTITTIDTQCRYCNGVGQIQVAYPGQRIEWTMCYRCNGNGVL